MKNTVITITSFLLCIILFTSEMLFLILYNVDNAVKRENVIELIDKIKVDQEIIKTDEYDKIENEQTKEIMEEIFKTKEVELYIKENLKAIYLNTLYNENMKYINSNEIKQEINNKLEIYVNENQITESQKEEIIKTTDDLIAQIDEAIEETNNEIGRKVIQTIVSKQTTRYILLGIIILTLLIYMVNRNETTLIWVGAPTIISGMIFITLALALTGKIDMINMDINIDFYGTINPYFNKVVNLIKKSGIITSIIGIIEIIGYTILKYRTIGSENNGEI